MTVPIDPPGQLQDFLDILRRRRWQVLLPLVVILAIGSSFAVIVPKKFKATTEVELRETNLDSADVGGRARTQAAREAHNAPLQLMALSRIKSVLLQLEWQAYLLTPKAEKTEYVKRLRKNLSVTVPKKEVEAGSTFVSISFLDVNPKFARDFLFELREKWIEEVIERDRKAVESKYDKLLQEQDDLGLRLERERRELAAHRSNHMLSPTQPAADQGQIRAEEPTVLQRNDYLMQREALDIEIQQEERAVEVLREQKALLPPELPDTREVKGQTFATELARLQKQLNRQNQELARAGLRPANSKWKKARRAIEQTEQRILELQSMRSEGHVEDVFRPNPDIQKTARQIDAAVRALETKKAKRIALDERITELSEKVRVLHEIYREDNERTQRVREYDARYRELSLRLQKAKERKAFLEGPGGNPFTITEEVQVPPKPTEPNPWLIVVFALIAGLAVGLGSAVVSEYARSSFRNPGEISRVMIVPVLGVVNHIITRSQRRRRLGFRLAVGLASFGFAACLAYVTWAWRVDPSRLPLTLADRIEDFRSIFK